MKANVYTGIRMGHDISGVEKATKQRARYKLQNLKRIWNGDPKSSMVSLKLGRLRLLHGHIVGK